MKIPAYSTMVGRPIIPHLAAIVKSFFQKKCTKNRPLCEGDLVGFTNFDGDKIWQVAQNKAVISNKFTNTHFLPQLAVSVLITQSIILGKLDIPNVMEFFIGWHGVVWGFAVVACMLLASAFEVASCADFQHKLFFCTNVVTNIQIFFFVFCHWKLLKLLVFSTFVE